MPTVDLTQKLSEEAVEAKARLRKRGLVLPLRPSYDLPRVPLDLTDKSSRFVMKLLIKLTRYQDHISGLLVLSEIDEQAAVTNLEVAKAQHLVTSWSGTSADRVAIAKADATLDPHVKDLDKKAALAKAQRKAYGVLVGALDRDAALVSRELTRRGNRGQYEGRVFKNSA